MNCHVCPYQKQIDRLRRRCLACNPETTGGTPHGKVRADEYTLNVAAKADGYMREPSGRATNLSPEAENRLRVGMASLFGIEPLDLLLVQHLMGGGSLDDFHTRMMTLAEAIMRYRGPSRAMAWARKDALLRKLPMLASVLKNNRENDTAARIEKELKRDGR